MATTVTDVNSDRWSHLPEDVRNEIDVYETELRRVQAGQMPEKVFLEFRLRHGVYGQRQEGVQMQRIKIPMGLLDNAKMHALADMSEEYADGVSHVTTRQDIQYHFVDINDTPNLMRRHILPTCRYECRHGSPGGARQVPYWRCRPGQVRDKYPVAIMIEMGQSLSRY